MIDNNSLPANLIGVAMFLLGLLTGVVLTRMPIFAERQRKRNCAAFLAAEGVHSPTGEDKHDYLTADDEAFADRTIERLLK